MRKVSFLRWGCGVQTWGMRMCRLCSDRNSHVCVAHVLVMYLPYCFQSACRIGVCIPASSCVAAIEILMVFPVSSFALRCESASRVCRRPCSVQMVRSPMPPYCCGPYRMEFAIVRLNPIFATNLDWNLDCSLLHSVFVNVVMPSGKPTLGHHTCSCAIFVSARLSGAL